MVDREVGVDHNRFVFLIGMRGVGKTSTAVKLANRWGCPMMDTDPLVAERVGAVSASAYFRSAGEPTFREVEANVVGELLRMEPSTLTVVALGGGTVLHPRTQTALQRRRNVVWLRAAAEVIRRRLTARGAHLDAIETTMTDRQPIYQRTATAAIDSDTATIDEVANAIDPPGEMPATGC